MKREGWDALEKIVDEFGLIATLQVIAGIMDNTARVELNPEYKKTYKENAELISKCANEIWWRMNP